MACGTSQENYLSGRTLSSQYGYDFTGNMTARANNYNVSNSLVLSETISPKRFGKDLSNQNAGGREVQAISDPVVFLKDLLSKFHE